MPRLGQNQKAELFIFPPTREAVRFGCLPPKNLCALVGPAVKVLEKIILDDAIDNTLNWIYNAKNWIYVVGQYSIKVVQMMGNC